MNPSPRKPGTPDSPVIVRHSVSDQVLTEIRKRIIHGDFPGGSLLPESHCATLLSVSRVPVREALMSLEREGLMERDTRGRTRVRKFTLRDYQEIIALRLELETMACRLAAVHRTEEQLCQLAENIESFAKADNAEDLAQLDVDFHRLLFCAGGNHWLLHAWGTISSPYQYLLTRNFRSYIQATSLEESKISALDHSRILEAIQLQKSADAERLMHQHISRWTEWTPPLD